MYLPCQQTLPFLKSLLLRKMHRGALEYDMREPMNQTSNKVK